MAPILPGLTDRPEQLEDVVRSARDAGASHVWANLLHLRDGTRQHFLDTLARHWPELLPRYQAQYRSGPYLPAERSRPAQEAVAGLARQYGVGDRPGDYLAPPPPEPQPEQLSLMGVG
jgi:DNA repair photolyase